MLQLGQTFYLLLPTNSQQTCFCLQAGQSQHHQVMNDAEAVGYSDKIYSKPTIAAYLCFHMMNAFLFMNGLVSPCDHNNSLCSGEMCL